MNAPDDLGYAYPLNSQNFQGWLTFPLRILQRPLPSNAILIPLRKSPLLAASLIIGVESQYFPGGDIHPVQPFSHVWLFVTPWTLGCQASLSITNSLSLIKLMSIKSVMPSNHLILCRPFLLLPSIFPSIRVFFKESVLYIRWPKYWSFSFSISPSNEYSGLISFRIDWLSKGLSRVFSSTKVQKYQFFGA